MTTLDVWWKEDLNDKLVRNGLLPPNYRELSLSDFLQGGKNPSIFRRLRDVLSGRGKIGGNVEDAPRIFPPNNDIYTANGRFIDMEKVEEYLRKI